MKVAFMGTPAFAGEALKGVLESRHDVVCVVSQPDRRVGRGRKLQAPPVASLAKEAGLPLLQPAGVGEKKFRDELAGFAPDVAVVAAYGQIFGRKLLGLPGLGCINIHASLLPRWRGAAPIQAAILAGDQETGIAIMQMSLGLDEGPVLLRRGLPIGPFDTGQELHDRLAALGREMIGDALDGLEAGTLNGSSQAHGEATYCPKLSKSDGCLNWSTPAAALERRIRALHPWPGTFTHFDGQRLKVLPPARVTQGNATSTPVGSVVHASKDGIRISTGSHECLELTRVQRPGRPVVDVAAFLAASSLRVGDLMGESA